MKKFFSIGETAKINNVSIQALRLYDKMGLLKPAYVDQENNYRYYTIDQFMYLDLIRYTKHIGAPLKEISDVLESKDVITLLSFLNKHQRSVEREIIRLKNISKAIGHIEDKIKYAIETKETSKIYFKEINKRFVIDISLNETDKESEIEIKLRSKDKILEENDIMFEGETGYFIYSDLLLNKGEICYKSVYTTLCMDDNNSKNINIKEVPKGHFMCITYLNIERERAINIIRNYIKENDIKPLGLIVEAQLFNTVSYFENDNALYELQILI